MKPEDLKDLVELLDKMTKMIDTLAIKVKNLEEKIDAVEKREQ